MAKQNKPAIRFKGFTDAWEQRKLGEIAVFSKGVGYSKNDLCEEGTPIILYGRLYTKYETCIFDVDTFVKEKAGSVYSKGGEVIVPASGETAEDISIASVVVKPGILLGGDLNIVSPTAEYDSAFLALTISSGATHKHLSSLAQGKSVVHLHNSDIQSVSAKFPTKREQEKIHLIFGKIDTLITLHQRKYDKLQVLKKAMLEKMFPKNGSSVPEIRFKGFTDAWEQRKLGEVANLLTGFPFESKKFVREGIKLVRGMNVKRGYLDFSEELCECWSSSQGLENYLLNSGDILIQMDGALIGKSYAKIKENQLPALLVQRVTRVRIQNQISDGSFVYQQIQKGFLTYIKGTKTETAVPHLSLNDIESFEIATPSVDEEKKIGAFFESLDHLITLHQRELEKLQNIKKSMLEKMFV